MTITVPIPEKVSLNRIYAGLHFSQRSRHKDAYYLAVMSARPGRYEGTFPVAMHYHFRLRGSRLDVSNHAYMQKMCEDALVAAGVLPDDDQKHVAGITMTAERAGKGQADEVTVTIAPARDLPLSSGH